MTRTHLLAAAAAIAVVGAPLGAQAPQPPKPIARADYIKTVDTHFNTIDVNHDGKLSREELAAEQQREMAQMKAKILQQLQVKFKELDTNKDGQLSFQEFLAAAPGLRPNESPDDLLRKLDTNHDGKISADEFRAPELAKFNRVDANHDGIVTPDEIKAANTRK